MINRELIKYPDQFVAYLRRLEDELTQVRKAAERSRTIIDRTGLETGAVVGAPGPAGNDGADGADGANGVGVPVGGGIGQVLAKSSAANYATEWVDPANIEGVSGTFVSQDGKTITVIDGIITDIV